MSIQSTLVGLDLPVAYGRFRKQQELPYIVYMGAGQNQSDADNTHYHSENSYQIEYYFKEKNEANEKAIEEALLRDGFNYDKSEDAYIESEGLFVIYYYV
jgi:hypothetical protein